MKVCSVLIFFSVGEGIVLLNKFGFDLGGLEEFHVQIVDFLHLFFDVDLVGQSQNFRLLDDFLIKFDGFLFQIIRMHFVVADGAVVAGTFQILEVVFVAGFDFFGELNFDFAILLDFLDKLVEILQILVPEFMVVFVLKAGFVAVDFLDQLVQFLLFVLVFGRKVLLFDFLPILFHFFKEFLPFEGWVFGLLLELFFDEGVVPASEVEFVLFVSEVNFLLSVFQVRQLFFLELFPYRLVLVLVLFQLVYINRTFRLFNLRQHRLHLLLLRLLLQLLEFHVFLFVQRNPLPILGQKLLILRLGPTGFLEFCHLLFSFRLKFYFQLLVSLPSHVFFKLLFLLL